MPIVPTYFQSQSQMSPAVSRPDEQPTPSTLPIVRKHKFPTPKLRLQLQDLKHEGSSIFLSNIKGGEDLEEQVQNVLNLLYLPEDPRPCTRSVTLVLREYGGLAYTTGMELDDDHKEIHLNLNYLHRVKDPRHEILGVLCHELVHCFQWAAEGTCPGGLIEGVADWVRLRAGLGAQQWKQEASGKWDGGYQHTAYFLEYLEQRFGEGTVRKLNACMRSGKYDEEKLFGGCCKGGKVDDLWKDYAEDLKKRKQAEGGADEEPAKPVPTHPAQSST